jgi:hypothetical protein
MAIDANTEFSKALHLIKLHITESENEQNRDLHNAVQHLVTGARALGLLLPGRELERPEEPDYDDAVLCCPDCEKPNQFGELCPECKRAADETQTRLGTHIRSFIEDCGF